MPLMEANALLGTRSLRWSSVWTPARPAHFWGDISCCAQGAWKLNRHPKTQNNPFFSPTCVQGPALLSPLPLLVTALCSVSTGGHFLSLGVDLKEDEEGKKPIPNPQSLLLLCHGPRGCGERGRATFPIPENSRRTLPHQDKEISSTQHHAGNEGGNPKPRAPSDS